MDRSWPRVTQQIKSKARTRSRPGPHPEPSPTWQPTWHLPERARKRWVLGRRACQGWLTSDYAPHHEAHGVADQGHEHPEGHQEVPVLTHTEQLVLQPLQTTWSGGMGSQPRTAGLGMGHPLPGGLPRLRAWGAGERAGAVWSWSSCSNSG